MNRDNRLRKAIKEMSKCTDVYLIVHYAHWTVVDYKWTGKWSKPNKCMERPCPIVYFYDDHNGEYEEYKKIPILNATSGNIFDWSFYKDSAIRISKLLEKEDSKKLAKLYDKNN